MRDKKDKKKREEITKLCDTYFNSDKNAMAKVIADMFPHKNSNTINSDNIKAIEALVKSYDETNTIIVLDIETNYDAIVQISYYVCNDKYDIIKRYNFFLNDGRHIRDFYKKISTDFIKKHGIHPIPVLRKLSQDFSKCKLIVGHNIDGFDIKKIKTAFEKFNIEYKMPEKTYCTMANSKDCVNALNKNGKIKNPKLKELSDYLTVEYDDNAAHDGLYDVDVTYKCYLKLLEINKMSKVNNIMRDIRELEKKLKIKSKEFLDALEELNKNG